MQSELARSDQILHSSTQNVETDACFKNFIFLRTTFDKLKVKNEIEENENTHELLASVSLVHIVRRDPGEDEDF